MDPATRRRARAWRGCDRGARAIWVPQRNGRAGDVPYEDCASHGKHATCGAVCSDHREHPCGATEEVVTYAVCRPRSLQSGVITEPLRCASNVPFYGLATQSTSGQIICSRICTH